MSPRDDGIVARHCKLPDCAAMSMCKVAALHAQGLEFIMYGDSITEVWTGGMWGGQLPEYAEAPQLRNKHFGHLKGVALAIAGEPFTTPCHLIRHMKQGLALQHGLHPADTRPLFPSEV